MPTHRYAPPLAEVRDPAAPDAAEREASAVSGRLIGDLSLVVENAMARFDAIPDAKVPDRGGGLSGAAQRDRARLSANKVLFNVFGLMAFLVIIFFLKPSFAVTGAASMVILAITVATVWRQHRAAPARLQVAVGKMPERLSAVAAQVAALRQALPPAYERLAEAIGTMESRMARIFNGGREDLAAALLKLTSKAFGYAGFAELAQGHPDVAKHIARLQDLIAQALAPTPPAG